MKMIRPYIIDWITVSIPSIEPNARALNTALGLNAHWERGRGRAYYSGSWKTEGITAFYNIANKGALLEISGTGIPRLEMSTIRRLLSKPENITRIDIALDYEIGITPDTIVKDAKINGMFNTASGITYYIGSPKSDVMLRVYMYHEPHPRQNVTRAEFVFRRYASKAIARAIVVEDGQAVKGTIEKFAKGRGIALGLGNAELALVLGKPKDAPTMASKVVWLQTQVAPAIKTMIDSGIDTMTILEYLGLVKK